MKNIKKCKLIFSIIATISLLLLGACDSESDYERNSRSGFEKWSSGDYGSMTREEKKAVNDFLEWSNEH